MNKILLVDDDRELTSLLKELLDMEGFNVLVAHDGEQALALLDDSVDLLLLDVMMPKKNGIDTLKELRQTHQTPVIMLTARGSELDRVLGLELGADDYLPKPFNDRAGGPYTRDSAPFPLERAAADDRSRIANAGSGCLKPQSGPSGSQFRWPDAGAHRYRIHPALSVSATSRPGGVA